MGSSQEYLPWVDGGRFPAKWFGPSVEILLDRQTLPARGQDFLESVVNTNLSMQQEASAKVIARLNRHDQAIHKVEDRVANSHLIRKF